MVQMERNLKGFTRYNTISGYAHLFLLVIIVLIGTGGLLYYSWQKGLIKTTPSQKLSPTPTISLNETSDWKTHYNVEYGFSFEYPEYLVIQEFGPSSPENCVSGKTPECVTTYNIYTLQIVDERNVNPPENSGFILDISIVRNNLDKNSKQLANLYAGMFFDVPEVNELLLSDELKGFYYEDNISGMGYEFWADFKNRDDIVIGVTWIKNNNLANQILSTFKFIE